MHRHTQIFKAFFALALVLCLFAGCASADKDTLQSNPDAAVITARGHVEREASTGTLADERENLSFFSKRETQTAAATTDAVTAAAATTDTAPADETAADTKAAAASEAEDAPTASAAYVCNKSSKKFHLPTCGSVDTMKPANRENYSGSRDDLIAKGYSPCQRCKP